MPVKKLTNDPDWINHYDESDSTSELIKEGESQNEQKIIN